MFYRLSIFVTLALCAAIPAFADSPPTKPAPLVAAKAITPGSWNVVFDDGTSRRMCLEDIEPLIQLAHAGPVCSRFVIADQPDRATVHYTCPGVGWGRTSVLVETPRLARINSQGISGRAPFALVAEARRVGDCASDDRKQK